MPKIRYKQLDQAATTLLKKNNKKDRISPTIDVYWVVSF